MSQMYPLHALQCGLWVRNRKGDIVRAAIPPSHLAFQVRVTNVFYLGAAICPLASGSTWAFPVSIHLLAPWMDVLCDFTKPIWQSHIAKPSTAHTNFT